MRHVFCWNNTSTGKDPIPRPRCLICNLIAAVILAPGLGRVHVREKGLKAKWNRRNAQLPCVYGKGETGEREGERERANPNKPASVQGGRGSFCLRRNRPST